LVASQAQAQADPSRTVRLHVVAESDEPVALYVPMPGGTRREYEALCVAPCDVDVMPALYRFGVERPGHRARRMPEMMRVADDMTLRVFFEDRSRTRLTGGLVLALGVLGGIGGVVAALLVVVESIRATFGGAPATNAPVISAILGGAVAVVCVPIGLVLALLRDVAEVRVDPDGALRF